MKVKTEVYKSLTTNFELDNKLVNGLDQFDAVVNIANGLCKFENIGLESFDGGSWDLSSSWENKITFVVSQSTGNTLENYQVEIVFPTGSTLYDYINDDGSDLRFYDTDGNELDYFIENWNEAGISRVWVELISLAASDRFYMYFGNSGATSNSNFMDTMWKDNHYTDDDCIACYHMDHHNQQAYSFNGVNNHINCGSDPSIDSFTQKTITAWFKSDGGGDSSSEGIVCKADSGSGWVFYFEDNANPRLYFSHFTSLNSGIWVTDNDSVSRDTWYYVSLSYDSTSLDNDPIIDINGDIVNVNEIQAPTGTINDDASSNFIIGQYNTSTINSFSGEIDDVKYFNTILTTTEKVQVMRGENVQTDNFKIWIDFEYEDAANNLIDLSGNGNNGAVSGATAAGTFLSDCPTCGSGVYHGDFKGAGEPKTTGTDGNRFGGNKAFLFDGINNEISNGTYLDVIPSSIAIGFSFCPDVTFDSGAGADEHLIAKQNVTNEDRLFIQLESSNGSMRFRTEQAAAGDNSLDSTTVSWTAGVWYHILCTWDTNNGKRIFVNGSLEATDIGETTLMGNGTDEPFYVGSVGAAFFNGKIAEVITYHEILSVADAMNIYKGNYYDAGTPQLYWNFKQYSAPTVFDQSGNDWDGTVSGALPTLGDYPFLNYCLEFLSATDYVDSGYDIDNLSDPTICTLGCSFKHDSTVTQGYILSTDDANLLAIRSEADGSIDIIAEGAVRVSTAAGIIEANKWYNVCAVFDGTNIFVYLKGRIIATVAYSGDVGDGIFRVSRDGTGFIGRIDEVRLWDSGLSGVEVQQFKNGDTTVDSANLILYYNHQAMTGGPPVTSVPDLSGNGNNGIISGDAIEVVDDINIFDGNLSATAAKEFLNDSLILDGTDDYLNMTNNSAFNFITSNFSFSFWIKIPDPTPGNKSIISRGDWKVDGYNVVYGNNRFYFFTSQAGARGYIETPGNIQANIWYSVVCVREDGFGVDNAAIYVNGIDVSVTTGNPLLDPLTSVKDFKIGIDEGTFGVGGFTIDELRVYDTALSADKVSRLYKETQPFASTISQIGSAYLFNEIPIGTVPEIDAQTFVGDFYSNNFNFRVSNLDTDEIAYLAVITSDRFFPKKPGIIQDVLDDNAKFAIYVKENSGVLDLYYTAWDDDNSQWWYDGTDWNNSSETSTGESLNLNQWYNCKINREQTLYNLLIAELDGTNIISTDLPYDDFTGSENLRFSNYDDTLGETADYELIGAINTTLSTNVEFDYVHMSSPIERITAKVILSNNFLSSDESMPNIDLSLDNLTLLDNDEIATYQYKEIETLI